MACRYIPNPSSCRPTYLVIFKGDDTNFPGNQRIDLVIDTELDLTGIKAHFRFMDFVQDFNEIPADKRLQIVIPNEKTSAFPLGSADASLTFEDASGKIRTVSNRIHVVVTNSVQEAYNNQDTQSITVTVTGTITWDMIHGKPNASDSNPLMDGEPSSGESSDYSRGDHRHPSDTSKRGLEDLDVRGNPTGEGSWFSVNGNTYTYSGGVWTREGSQLDAIVPGESTGAYGITGSGGDVGFSLDADYSATVSYLGTTYSIIGYVDTLAKVSEIPAIDVTLTQQGAAADAKAVGDALRSGFTPWEFGGSGYDSTKTYSVLISPSSLEGNYDYDLKIDGVYAETVYGTNECPTSIDFTTSSITATRHLITPTKTSQLTNDGAPNGGGTPYATTEQIPNVTGKADKVANATAGNLASLTAQGNLADSGVKPSDFATPSDIPYRLVTIGEWVTSNPDYAVVEADEPEAGAWWSLITIEGESKVGNASGNADSTSLTFVFGPDDTVVTATRSFALLDRAGNRVVVSGDTTLTLPAAVPGYLRDFLVRLEISGSTVPTITFAAPTGETITYETDGDEFPVPDEAGNWLYSFTESCVAHKFAVSLKKVNVVAQGGS